MPGPTAPGGIAATAAGSAPGATPSRGDSLLPEPQSAGAVLMVRPARFGFNPQTAASNAFQSASPMQGLESGVAGTADEAPLREFDRLAEALVRAGVTVIEAADTASPVKPDAIFPNNWVSFHGDGAVVLYPMLAPNRRWERREEILSQVIRQGRFRASRTVDLTHREDEAKYLEGTGSLVLDRAHRVAYAGLSPRTDLDVLGEFSQLLDYHLVTFETEDAARPIYHTNVLMAIGTGFAAVCLEAIGRPAHRSAVAERLRTCGHEILEISRLQMQRFAGNLLELAPPAGRIIALSTTAWDSLDAAQRRILERHGSVLAADVPVIERLGGGGVRCMLAEVHLPKLVS